MCQGSEAGGRPLEEEMIRVKWEKMRLERQH